MSKGRTKYKLVWEHRVVAEQMLGRPLRPGEVVHHKNGNGRDNRPENLEIFASHAEHMRVHMLGNVGGENHPQAKLTNEQADEIRRRYAEGERNGDLSREFGVSPPTVSRIARRGGYQPKEAVPA